VVVPEGDAAEAIDPLRGWICSTLTHNAARGAKDRPDVDAANPRAADTMGHIIRWHEDGDFDGTPFDGNHLVLAGDPDNERAEAHGNVRGDLFACPDGIAFGARGVLWSQTDIGTTSPNRGEMARLGNDQMLACDVTTGEVRRFSNWPDQRSAGRPRSATVVVRKSDGGVIGS